MSEEKTGPKLTEEQLREIVILLCNETSWSWHVRDWDRGEVTFGVEDKK